MIAVLAASVVTFLTSMLLCAIFTFLFVFTLGFVVMPIFKKNGPFVLQFMTYFVSALCGLLAGYWILAKWDEVSLFWVLYIAVLLPSMVYQFSAQRFATEEAARLNKIQKRMERIGVWMSILVFHFLFIYR